MARSFTFSEERFNRLFPFYILINQQMVIETYGEALEKICSVLKGKLFFEYCTITAPAINQADFESLKGCCNQELVIECGKEQPTRLRGLLEYLPETNQLLFVGSPWPGTIEDGAQQQYPLTGGVRHLKKIHASSTQDQLNDDTGLPDIVSFHYQDPDPVICIDYSGKILQTNPAAAGLDIFECNTIEYSRDALAVLIAGQVNTVTPKWFFEAHSNGRVFAFVCIDICEHNCINIYGRDITQTKKEERHLNSLSLIVRQTHQAVVITDAQARVEWVNESFEKMTGYAFDEVQGKSPGSILQGPGTSPGTVKYMRRQIRKGRPFTCEVYNYKKSGEGYWLRINCHPVFDAQGKLIQFFAVEENITFEKAAQEKVKETASRMSSLINNLQAGVLLENEDRTIALVNQHFCKMFNITTAAADMVGSNCSALAEQARHLFKDPVTFISLFNEVLQKREPVTGEILAMTDGRSIERDYIPVWNEGRYEGHLWVYTDITEKINADKKIAEQRVFYEEILDNIPADIAVFDDQHHYLYVNPKGINDAAMRKWIIGKKDEDYLQYRNKPMSIAAGRRTVFNSIIKNKQLQSWEEELLQPDGSNQYMLRHMSPVMDDNDQVKMVIGYAVDVTQTKAFLLQIEQSEKRYRDVIENSLAIVTTHDMEGRFLTVNPMVGKTFGYDDNEMIGHSLLEFIKEEDRPLFNEQYLDKIKKEKIFSGIFKVIHKNGDIIYTLYNNFLKEEAGEEPYVIGFAMDISDRVKVEKELKIAKKMTEELAQTKQNFLANMSHEIRTPMNAIMGMANQLGKTTLNKNQLFYLNIILSASENLLVIINDILDLSKMESGKLSIERIGFEPKLVIGRVMEVMRHKAEEKGLAFTNSFCDNELCGVLLGDPFRLNQILLNLVSNAIKFTEKGTVDISCKVIAETADDQTVEVQVKDTGIGMDASFAKNIFRKYAQENQSTTRLFGGTGLGMSICEELIRLMGGTIEVKSKKGEGTTVSFVISFGKGAQEQLPVKELPLAGTGILKDKKILVTDDNEMNRLVATTILNNYGVITEEATNGSEAVEKVKQQQFDIVLMDVQMPVMDGVEATQAIRQHISTDLPIIALTAFAIKGDNTKFINAGMNDYLSKPFEENQLLQMVCRWLEKKQTKMSQEIIQENPVALYDLRKLYEIANGNQEFVDKMVNLFIEQVPLAITEIYAAYQQKDFARIRAAVIRIKAPVANMGIGYLKNDLQQIESFTLGNKHSGEFTRLIQHVDMSIQKVVESIKSKAAV